MSRRIAFGGILTALCVVLIYAAAYLPSGKLGIYVLSSLVIAGAVIELGIKWGTIVYAASAALILLLLGSINAFLLFTTLFGSYPLIKYRIESKRRAVPQVVSKLTAINILGAAGYFIFKALLGISPINLPGASSLMVIGIIIAAQLAFLFYDYILTRLIAYYMDRIRFIRP